MKTIATIALAVALGLAWVGAAIPAETVKEKAADTKDTIKDKAIDAKDKIKEKATEAKDKVKGAFKRDNNKDKANGRVSRGADVRPAQEALRDKGFDPGPIDGVMGPRTRAAVTDFQKKEGLEASGRLDATTMARLGVETRSSAADPTQPSASPSMGGDSSKTPKTAPQPSKKQAQ